MAAGIGPTALATPYSDPSELPDAIYIKTPYQSFNNAFYFALVDGRLYAKPRTVPPPGEPEAATPGGWTLFYGTGLPFREESDGKTTTARGFDPTARLLRVTADDDEVIVIGENGRQYWKRENPTRRFDARWYDEWGFPIRQPFALPEHGREALAWGVGRRRVDSTGYFTDPDGDPHVSGFGITTVYYLDQDGQTIWYADTGLPPRLSHRMCGPLQNRAKLVNLSASGSTMMVIDQSGRVRTRLADFDTTGGTPGHRYTYKDEPPDGLDPYDVRTIDTKMGLPPEDWLLQPPIFPAGAQGQQAVSMEISITQNGEGNDARELRVVGRGADGALGYYYKQIDASAWAFRPAKVSLPEIRWLDPARVADPVDALGQETANDLYGFLEVKGYAPLPVEIEGWDVACTPAQASVALPTGEVVRFEVHSVDAWTPWREEDPGYDGTTASKLITLWVSDEALQSADPEVQAFVEDALSPYHRETFALWGEGSEERLVIDRRGLRGGLRLTAVQAPLDSADAAAQLADALVTPSAFIERALEAPQAELSPEDASTEELQAALDADALLLRQMRDQASDYARARRRSVALSGTLIAVNGVLRLTGVRLAGRVGDHLRPRVKRPTKFGVWTSKVSYVLENTSGMVIRSAQKDKLERERARAGVAGAEGIIEARMDRVEGELEQREAQ